MKLKPLSFWQRKFIWDCIMATLVLLLPFTLYVHVLFDNHSENIYFFGFFYEHESVSNSFFVWTVLIKLISILLLLIWLLNTPHWWRYLILVPIVTWLDSLVYTFFYIDFIENYIVLFSVLINMLILILVISADKLLFKNIGKIPLPSTLLSYFLDRERNFYLFLKSKRRTAFSEESKKGGVQQLKDFLVMINKFKRILNNRSPDQLGIGKYQKFDNLIIFLLLIIPLLFYVYKFIPFDIQTLEFSGLKLESYGFPDIRTFLWYFKYKLCILIPCCLWFITCKHWWRFAILSPIILTVFQLWEGFKNNSGKADEIEIFQALPIVSLLILLLLFISRVVNYQTKLITLHEKITVEVDELIGSIAKSTDVGEKREKFKEILIKSEWGRDEENLNSLLDLKKELLDKIKAPN